ncbi:MAG: type III-B CRISPR module-associated protein Cmr3 [Bacillota bacterium]|nr:type III-B CRISPR module-associated protein Cmr3 [Bacillota bacterium]
MKLSLTPMDTFFFGNHKSFVPGVDHFAEGIFPPRPGTVYGALRSAYIHATSDFNTFVTEEEKELRTWMGSPTEYGKFELSGIFWKDEKDIVLPLPYDHQVIMNNDDTQMAKRLKLVMEKEAKAWGSDQSPYRLYGVTKQKSGSARGQYVYKSDLARSLVEASSLSTYSVSHWLGMEQTMGIAHDQKTRTTKEGMLYAMEMLRFKNETTSVVAFSDQAPDFSKVNVVTLGAKQRPWSLTTKKQSFSMGINQQELINAIEETGVARLILLTSALWKYGNRPACWNKQENALVVNEVMYPLLATAMGRPSLVGGWDMVRHRPKPRYNAIPSGSVIYLAVPKGEAKNLIQSLHEVNFSDEMAQLGYGLTVVGCGVIS